MRITLKLSFLTSALIALFAISNSAIAFHEAAGLKCMACHTMHASENGSESDVIGGNGFDAALTSGVTSGGNPMLLVQANETDLCLACHGEGVSSNGSGPKVMSSSGTQSTALPGGDFWTSTQTHSGDDGRGGEGHNPYHTPLASDSAIIPADENLSDPLTPPGASNPIGKWDCVACHAPHQNDNSPSYGQANPDFRMLWSKPAGLGSGVTFNAVEGSIGLEESDTNHSGYRDNVSTWCAVCHPNFHNEENSDWLIHPTDAFLNGSTGIFNIYNGNPAGGANYSIITPIQDPNATSATDFAATTSSSVMCLSCHRAHAASTTASHSDYANATRVNRTRNMTRWSNEVASGSGLGCNKCHDKGE